MKNGILGVVIRLCEFFESAFSHSLAMFMGCNKERRKKREKNKDRDPRDHFKNMKVEKNRERQRIVVKLRQAVGTTKNFCHLV